MNSNSLVLSEVHVGAAASHARTGVVSRFVVPFGPSIAEANHDSADVPSFVANRQRKRRSGSEPHAQDSSLNRVSAQAKSCSGKRNSAQDATERSIVVDADGDVDVPRRRKAYASLVLCISHAMATPLESVGLQVWSAALLVGDWLLQQRDDQQAAGMHMLELGAGTGLVSCLAARVCGARVYCTETGEAVLANCLDNAERNRGGHGHVIVRELDWRRIERHPLIKGASRRQSAGRDARFEWQQQDIDDVLNNTSLILGADLIYDDDITDALVKTLRYLLARLPNRPDGQPPHCIMAMEKRLCFTIEEMDVTARAYSHFEAICLQHPDFGARRLPNDFPAVLLTNRTPQMELWDITLASRNNDAS